MEASGGGVDPEWERHIANDPWVQATEKFEPRARQLLGIGPDVGPEDLLNAFAEQQRIAEEADQRLESTQFTTTNENGIISVTMTGKAQILSLAIGDEAYVRYRPAELGPVVLDTVNRAMTHCGELVRESLVGVLGDESALDAIMESWPGAHHTGDEPPPADWT
jgi:DNA-binding protein YbaB